MEWTCKLAGVVAMPACMIHACCMHVTCMLQVAEQGDACTDACDVVWQVGSGDAPCRSECSVGADSMFPRIFTA